MNSEFGFETPKQAGKNCARSLLSPLAEAHSPPGSSRLTGAPSWLPAVECLPLVPARLTCSSLSAAATEQAGEQPSLQTHTVSLAASCQRMPGAWRKAINPRELEMSQPSRPTERRRSTRG